MSPNTDVCVVGGGAAGLSSAATLAEAGLRVTVLDGLGGGGELLNFTELRLDPLGVGCSGPDLAARLLERALAAGVDLEFSQAQDLRVGTDRHTVVHDGGSVTASAVLIASGLRRTAPPVPDADALVGRGISFCGACDGPLYKGRPVAVVGTGRNAAYEALEIGSYAERVLFVTTTDLLGEATRRALADVPHLTTVDGTLAAIHAAGDGPVSGIDVVTRGDRAEYQVAGVLSAIEVPNTEWCPPLIDRDAAGHIVVDAALRSSIPTVLAVGDVRTEAAHSAFASVADGLTAAATILGSAPPRP